MASWSTVHGPTPPSPLGHEDSATEEEEFTTSSPSTSSASQYSMENYSNDPEGGVSTCTETQTVADAQRSIMAVQPGIGPGNRTGPSPSQSSWSPLYLKRYIILGLGASFVFLAVAIEILQWVSKKNNGLATSNQKLQYLWSFGPTVVLTILASIWARVFFQASMAAPWVHMHSGRTSAERSILLDYTSMLLPETLVRALRNRDWMVAISGGIGLIIQVEIIFSTSLITLTPTDVVDPSFPITLTTEFGYENSTFNATIQSAAITSRYITMGLVLANLSYPAGTDGTIAYQEFDATLPDDAQLTATVAAFEADLECETAHVNLSCEQTMFNTDADFETWEATMFASMASSSCKMAAEFGMSFNLNETDPLHFSRVLTGQCDGAPEEDGNRVAFVFGVPKLTWTTNTTGPGDIYGEPDECRLGESSAIICQPTHRVGQVGIKRNGTSTSTFPVSSDNPTQKDDALTLASWTIAESVFNETAWQLVGFEESIGSGGWRLAIQNATIDVDRRSITIYGNEGRTNLSISALLNTDYLQGIFTSYYKKHAAQLARAGLMYVSSKASSGNITTLQNRLLVQPLASHTMSALLALTGLTCIVVCATNCIYDKSVTAVPASRLASLGTVLGRNPHLLADWIYLGSKTDKEVKKALSQADYYIMPKPELSHEDAAVAASYIAMEPHLSKDFKLNQNTVNAENFKTKYPLALHPLARLAICLILLAIIITLEVTLRISQRNNGLGSVRQDGYAHYVWTNLPAICFTLVAMDVSFIDSAERIVAPYLHLRKIASFDKSIGLDLLDASIPKILYRELQIRDFPILAVTVASLLAANFNTFTSSLFTVVYAPTVYQAEIYTTSTFSINATNPPYALYTDLVGGPESLTSSLVLTKDLSFPAFTHRNLAFPEYTISFPENSTLDNDSFATQAIVPALRVALTCRRYNSSDILASFTKSLTTVTGLELYPMNISVIPENNRFTSSSLLVDTTISNTSSAKTVPFGVSNLLTLRVNFDAGNILEDEYSSIQPWGTYSNVLFTWGSVSPSPNRTIHVEAMGCNETLEVLYVNTTFSNVDLSIVTTEPIEPPVSTYDMSTAHTANTTGPIMSSLTAYYPSTWDDVANLTSPFKNNSIFDDYMALLVAQKGSALTMNDFGDVDKSDAIVEAVKSQYGILAAQKLNYEFRLPSGRVDARDALENITSLPGASAGSDYRPEDGPRTTIAKGQLRLVQDATLTRVLQGILGAVLGLTLFAWAAGSRTNVLPRDSMSIGSLGALIAGGNLGDYFDKMAERTGQKGEEKHLTYWLGWRKCKGDQGVEKRFGIWVVDRQGSTGGSGFAPDRRGGL
ncbi:hypothetical protein M406DRAFT_109128 [Cryphonectria parasitica EP155]|uniref:Uncharacterized protein n=1 Tax=Cryphonectria parasitica (strain ATCC 38755 / EP155) TaxID=660469 RepID=A0A9P4XRV8_CRYP1|nr:uncharacterized protein M406DRAFT_109128 [Cryphonectria parasitica EP155]KAF3759893.1 hypothetical protein M406DRAFT_109128 [Cryphonectria parasitica EP155]